MRFTKKLMMKLMLLLTVGLRLVCVSAFGQSIVFDILVAGRDVGELKITPAQLGGSSESLRVEGAINTLFYDVVYIGENHFEKGVLKSSLSSQEVNGRLKEKTRTVQSQDSYEVIFADAKSPTPNNSRISHPINNTVTSLYYREPVNMKQIYSDRFGKMCPVKKIGSGAYEVMMPDGKKATYTYHQGQCREVRSEIVGIDLIFRIRPDSLP
jgi:hypothetical protein